MALVKASVVLTSKAALVGAILYAFVDPAWAVPVQTLLLIILVVVQQFVHRGVKRTEASVDAAKVNATHAASAAAAAAAVARDSNRIVKDIGSALRTTEAPTPPESTDA